MIVGAVICEFNPFHNGHKYLIDEMKKDGCDCVIAVMSTSFTQRGDVAVYSKFHRAKDALMGGADLIIELPVVWAVSSAQRFAKAGCEIIKSLGCVDRVYFGSESGNIDLLKACAAATEDESVQKCLRYNMQKGDYYPVALQKAVNQLYSDEISDVLSSPNNTLGIEYIKSLKGSSVEVITIKRVGASHDSEVAADNFASASKIRADIEKDRDVSLFLPESNAKEDNFASFSNGERALVYKLRLISPTELEKLPDVSEGLHNRILSAARTNQNITEILDTIKTKRYTHARLRRIITCALLNISKDIQELSVPYVRILGYNTKFQCVLKEIFEKSSLPVIMNVAKAEETLSEDALSILRKEINATDLRTVFEKNPTPCSQDFTEPIIKI